MGHQVLSIRFRARRRKHGSLLPHELVLLGIHRASLLVSEVSKSPRAGGLHFEVRHQGQGQEPLLEDFWRKFAIGVTILGTSVPAFLDGGWEVATVLIASERWGWKESRTGYMIGGVLGSVLFSNGMVAWLSYRYEDRWIILAFFVL